jgi:ubiquinone/menaquinone biosynthesis C-methylase UbiE
MISDFIKKSGQEMYFDKEKAQEMIERENNVEHLFVSKIFEAVLYSEFKDKKSLKIADLGAGAHLERYTKILSFLRKNGGKLYWVDQSPYMLEYASERVSLKLNNVVFVENDIVDFLEKEKEFFDALVFKYSFNYLISKSLKEWMRTMYESLKRNGKVFANLHFHEEGIKSRSYNAIYKIKGKKVESGYKPKNNEVIEVCFLKRPGDKSLNPEIFASTKIIYYSPEIIEKFAQEVGFSSVRIFKNWEENDIWRKTFEKLNHNLERKPKTFLLLEK